MRTREESGFTLIELLMAMAVFSFMLLIIVSGFINIVRLHNQALASNIAQDNARTAMDELVRAVRDSAGVTSVTTDPLDPTDLNSRLCLASASGPDQLFYVDKVSKILMRREGCASTAGTTKELTSKAIQVANFGAKVETGGTGIVKPSVELTVTVASHNTTTGSGAAIACGPTSAERTFCSVVTLTSGAVPR